MTDDRRDTLLTLTAEIVASHVANNNISVSDVPALISNVHNSLAGLGATAAEPEVELNPAVSIRASVKPEYIICLEDGKRSRTLKRHLRTAHGLTPEQYRAKWSLPSDYPMVAPAYAEIRRGLAISAGLGKKRRSQSRAGKTSGRRAEK